MGVRFFFLTIAVVFFMTGSVMAAEDSAIRIIREDGSVTEYSLPEEAVPAVSPAAAPVKKEAPLPQVRPPIPPVPEQVKQTQMVVPASSVYQGPPVPGRKPAPLKRAERVIQKPEDRMLPRSLAVSIAISHAPPARDFKVMQQVYDDIPVYEIVFATDDGPYTVRVDARSGDVLFLE